MENNLAQSDKINPTHAKEKLSEQRILESIAPPGRSFRLAGEDDLMQRIAKMLRDWVLVEITAHPEVARPMTRGKVRTHKRNKTSDPKATH